MVTIAFRTVHIGDEGREERGGGVQETLSDSIPNSVMAATVGLNLCNVQHPGRVLLTSPLLNDMRGFVMIC